MCVGLWMCVCVFIKRRPCDQIIVMACWDFLCWVTFFHMCQVWIKHQMDFFWTVLSVWCDNLRHLQKPAWLSCLTTADRPWPHLSVKFCIVLRRWWNLSLQNETGLVCVPFRVTTWCLWLSFSGGLKWWNRRLCSPESSTQKVQCYFIKILSRICCQVMRLLCAC